MKVSYLPLSLACLDASRQLNNFQICDIDRCSILKEIMEE